jgi:hypothetical protein
MISSLSNRVLAAIASTHSAIALQVSGSNSLRMVWQLYSRPENSSSTFHGFSRIRSL